MCGYPCSRHDNVCLFGSNNSAAPHQHIGCLMRKIGGRVFSIDGRNFSSVQARLTAFARSHLATALATALQPSIPMRRVTGLVRAFRERRLSLCLGDALSQRIWEGSKQNLRQDSPSQFRIFPRRTSALGASRLTVVHAKKWNRERRCSGNLCTVTLQKEWPDTSVQRKHAGDTNMQHLGCQLPCSVRAFRAGKNERLSTDVVQRDESEKTMPPFMF